MASIIGEFIQALDEEIEAVKRGRGGSIVKVFNGRFVREVSGLFVYVFNLENFLAVLDESPAEIEIRGHRYLAQVLLTQGLEVEIGIQQFCGQHIPEARLQTNLWYLLELLKNKYAECQSGSAKVDFHLSEALFSGQQSNSKQFNGGELHYSLSGNSPNPAQRLAIEASFSSQLCVVWGPPGTGKTETIAKAIEAHLNAGRRVLLVSHANNAVDEALEDVAEQLRDTPFYQEGKLVRLGTPQHEHLTKLETDYPLVLLNRIALKLGESLVSEKNALESENARLDGVLTQFVAAFSGLQKVKTLSSELDNLQAAISESTRRLAIARHDLTQLEEAQRTNRGELTEAQSAGTLKRLFRRLDPQKIQRDIDQTSIAIDSKKRLVQQIGARLNELANSNDTKEREANEAKAELESLLKLLGVSLAEVEAKRAELDQRKNAVLARLAEINRQLDEIETKVLSEARLVATTLTKTFVARQFPEVPFDVLILDEASMAPLPHLYWAASRCREFVTIVGDFLQLPPICIANDKTMAQKWLKRSIFSVLGINSVGDADSDPRVKLLDTQYRMVPAISAIPNSLFYAGRLKDDPGTLARKLDDGFSDSPLVLIETSAMNPWCSQLPTVGRFNLYNALVCTTLAKRIIPRLDGIRKACNDPNAKIGILTPYRAQARLMNKIAKDWGLSDHVRISTIHLFQGGQEPIIIFDSCEGPGIRVAPMLDDTREDSDARLVLNVATTRARDRLYFVGHTEHLLAGVHRNSTLAWIIHHFYQKAEVLGSETLVDSYFTTDFEKWAEALLPTAQPPRGPVSGDLYTERNFWAQFFQDLRSIKERLIILSPFITVNRSGRLMEFFRAIIRRGVEIRIYTRPRNQQTGEMANQADIVIKQLRSIGVKVIERRSMHQKVAIIDNAIAWEGSLNILSHRDTGEQMRRFEGPSAIEEIIRNLELDEDMPVGSQTEEVCPGQGCGRNDGFLVVRVQRGSGRRFLGCSNYGKGTCRYTRPLGKLNNTKDRETASGKS